MCDWHRYVRENLSLTWLDEGRARDVMAEVASQLEEVYLESLAGGASEGEAQATARAHIQDWEAFSRKLVRAKRSRRRIPGDAWAQEASESLRARGGPWVILADLLQDLRYSLRSLRSSPGFSIVAILTLALGIGGVATIFTLYDQILVRPLPFQDSDQLVQLWEELGSFGGAMVAYPNFQDWRERNRSFRDMAIWNEGSVNLTGSGDPEEIDVIRVSASGFSILGVGPALGRGFLPEDDRLGAPGVVVLSHTWWRDRFGEDPEIVGRVLTLDDNPFTVVGVMPREFLFPQGGAEVDAFVPIEPFAEGWINNRGTHPGTLVLARLLPEVPLETARQDLERIALELEAEYPDTNEGSRVNSALLKDRVTRRAAEPLKILLASVAFLLLIACINVANLVLARSTSRQQEMAVRVSIGAGGGRILRLLLTESVVLWTLGGILGTGLALFGVRGIVALLAGQIPPLYQVGLDLRVVGMVMAVSMATGLLFGLPPALRVVRQDLREFLKEGVRTTSDRRRNAFRSSLVIAEVSLAVALLVGAGLTLRSFGMVVETSPGLDPENVLVAEVNLPEIRYPEEVERTAFFTRLLDALREIPGVESAATAYNVPLGPGGWQNAYHVEGTPPETGGEYSFAEVNAVSTDYFGTMGIPLLAGREFTRQDDGEAPQVVIVGQEMAERYWPGEDPLGKRLKWGTFTSENDWMEVVGVAGQVKVNGVTNETLPQLYIPHWQDNDSGYYLVLKTRGEPLSVAEPVRRAVLSLDPALPLASVGTMTGYVAETTRSARLLALLMAIFAGAAVLLAGVGIYGVMAQATGERRHEIGIRVALGAQTGEVLRMIFLQGLATMGGGVVLGMVLAVAVGRLIRSQLYQVSERDPLTFFLTLALVTAVAVAANLIPARRAARVDPVRALQAE